MGKYQDRQWKLNIDDYELAEKLEKEYWKHGVKINIKKWYLYSDRIIFKVKLKGKTREAQLYAYKPDVQFRLKVPVFQVIKQEFNIFILISDKKIVYPHLFEIVKTKKFEDIASKMRLPCAVGHDFIGALTVFDLNKSPHLLLGGSTLSGKSVGLQSLIASIAYSKSPYKINFILIDVGATDLISFNGIPHLSCPVVRDRGLACRVLLALTEEMERRMDLKIKYSMQFDNLPSLVLAIDEFPALLSGLTDAQTVKIVTSTISSLLQRGRHANIHVVLAAQNPTMQNMKVDLGNITARMAFKCAKKNFSETIIGEGGAENLMGQGDMLFKSPRHPEMKRLQGVYVSGEELEMMRSLIMLRWDKYSSKNRYKFVIQEENLRKEEFELGDNFIRKSLTKKEHVRTEDKLFAEIMLWTLKQDTISCNMLMAKFNLGWNRANRFIERLYDLDIVSDLDAKLPRKILPQSVHELSGDAICILKDCGFSVEDVSAAIEDRH